MFVFVFVLEGLRIEQGRHFRDGDWRVTAAGRQWLATYRSPGEHLDRRCGGAIEHAWCRERGGRVAVGCCWQGGGPSLRGFQNAPAQRPGTPIPRLLSALGPCASWPSEGTGCGCHVMDPLDARELPQLTIEIKKFSRAAGESLSLVCSSAWFSVTIRGELCG